MSGYLIKVCFYPFFYRFYILLYLYLFIINLGFETERLVNAFYREKYNLFIFKKHQHNWAYNRGHVCAGLFAMQLTADWFLSDIVFYIHYFPKPCESKTAYDKKYVLVCFTKHCVASKYTPFIWHTFVRVFLPKGNGQE